MATIAVIGATGGIGRHVVAYALEAGHTVQALSRRAGALRVHERLKIVEGGVDDVAAVSAVVQGADFVLSCLGTRRGETPIVAKGTAVIVDAMKQSGVERMAMISSLGIGDSAAQGKRVSKLFMYAIAPIVLRQRFYELADAEAIARALPKAVIVRPTGLSNAAPTGRYVAVDSQSKQRSLMIPRADVAQFW